MAFAASVYITNHTLKTAIFAIYTEICVSQRETDREIETKTHYIAQGRPLDRVAMN